MSILPVLKLLWKFTKISDDKRIASLPFPGNITEKTDIVYEDDGDRYHLLDVYYPKNTTEKLPVIVDIHGGGWMYGDKELNKCYNLYLAKRGFTVFSLSYRLVPKVTVQDQLQDVFKALKKIEELMPSLPCDPDKVFLTGDSAGGMLAGYTALLSRSPELQDIFVLTPHRIDFKSVGLVSPFPYMDENTPVKLYTKICLGKGFQASRCAGYLNFTDLFPFIQKFPPFFIVTSSGDFLAKKQSERAFHDLKKIGAKVRFMYWGKEAGNGNLPHVFSVLHPENAIGSKTIDTMLAFFQDSVVQKS